MRKAKSRNLITLVSNTSHIILYCVEDLDNRNMCGARCKKIIAFHLAVTGNFIHIEDRSSSCTALPVNIQNLKSQSFRNISSCSVSQHTTAGQADSDWWGWLRKSYQNDFLSFLCFPSLTLEGRKCSCCFALRDFFFQIWTLPK